MGGAELGLAIDGTGWRATRTSDNREGDGLATPCQEQRYADPRARAALVRSFTTSPAKGEPKVSAVQTAELSDNLKAARRTWDQSLAWYAGCTAPQVQLGRTMRVAEVGDEAMLVQLRDWSRGRTYLAGVARTGQITTTTFFRTDDNARPDVAGATRMLVMAVNGMCPTPQGGGCATTPETGEVAPVPVGEVPGLLASVDLPMVPKVHRPWVGTEAARGTRQRRGHQLRPHRLHRRAGPQQRHPDLPDPRRPPPGDLRGHRDGRNAAVGGPGPRVRLRHPAQDGLVRRPRPRRGRHAARLRPPTSDGEHAVWRVTVEISDEQTVTYLMGVVRRGSTVAQIGFVPGRDITIGPEPFEELLLRAGERLAYLPRR